MRLFLTSFVFLTLCLSVRADVSDTLPGVFSPGIKIGTSIAKLKEARENLLDGPETKGEDGPSKGTNYQILMDIQTEAPQAVFWYLVDKNQVVGYLRLRAMKTESEDFVNKKTADIYRQMCGALGKPRQEEAVRGGPKGFAKVRVDKWDLDSEDGVAFLIATNQDITTGFVKNQTYPIGKILIKPDPARFHITDSDNTGLLDISRPENVTYGVIERTRPHSSTSDEAIYSSKLPVASANASSTVSDSRNTLWIILAVIAGGGVAFYLFKRLQNR